MQNAYINSGDRYPGGRSFKPEESSLYFGREKDIDNLIDLISIKQTIVLYGKSGYGKSSLINAGVIPNLQNGKDICYVPFYIKFNPHSEKKGSKWRFPAEAVRVALARGSHRRKHPDFDKITTEKNSFWYWIKLRQLTEKKNSRIRFVLLFDQFEELFSYPPQYIDAFSKLLSQLLYEPVPLEFLVKFKQIKEEQIKEGHTFDPEFLQLLYQKPDVSVVFSIRSDRMSQMNMLSDRHPSILKTCYELDALSAEEAKSAIVRPARLEGVFKTPVFGYEKSTLDMMLEYVTNTQDKKIEATTLQILCRYIEYNIVKSEDQTLSKKDLGDITNIFRKYYEDILKKLDDDEKESAESLLEDKLVDGENRNLFTEEFIIKQFKVSKELLKKLEDSSLIKKERDSNRGKYLYEISHDTIVKAVNTVAEERKAAAEKKGKEQEIAAEKRAREEEEKKNQTLQLSLTRERRAKRNFRKLFVIAIFLLVILGVVFVMWVNSSNKEKIAQEQNKEALKKIDSINALDAEKALINYGDGYSIDSLYYSAALRKYQLALDLIKVFPDDSLYKQVNKRINDLRRKINRNKNLNH